MPVEEIDFTHESAASGETAKRMARASLGVTLKRARVRLCVVVLLVSASFFILYGGDGLSLGARVFGSVFWATVLTVVVVVVCSALAYAANFRNFRRTLPPGTVQRTGFGRDEFVTANALSSSRFSYRAVHSVDSHGGFVFIRFVGQPVMRVYPRELFPPDAMTRLREAAARRGSGGPSGDAQATDGRA